MINFGGMFDGNIASLKQAINLSNLRNVMHQDQQSIANLMEGMEKANTKIMELSVEPHKGSNVNIRL